MKRAVVSSALLLLLSSCADPKDEGYQPPDIGGPVVFVSGLLSPTKVILTPRGNLLVAEAGDEQPNHGRVSLVDRRGDRRTLLDGLPSAVNPFEEFSGPSGLVLSGRMLYVAIGEGDGTRYDPVSDRIEANASPSSPILSAVLSFELAANFETRGGDGLLLTVADHDALAGGIEVELAGDSGERAKARLVGDFPDSQPDPAIGVRASNPYGLALASGFVYVADAGMNRVSAIEVATGRIGTLADFPALPNPLPFGPPGVDAVPDNVHFVDGSLLVTLLTGFPFAVGLSEVRRIDLATGAVSTYVGGLSSAIDAVPARIKGRPRRLLVLEFSADLLADEPGRLRLLDPESGTFEEIAEGLIGPTSVAVNERTGDLFVTAIDRGEIIRVQVD